ncbi:hypothetical protein MGSAQ_001481 [marine sediment metagenome]|uniref:Uncharacterized protein n=1 Tax=marine sediment metagenome TaxID=412755 RepID=A0A1B6NUH4_9ZZZZ
MLCHGRNCKITFKEKKTLQRDEYFRLFFNHLAKGVLVLLKTRREKFSHPLKEIHDT